MKFATSRAFDREWEDDEPSLGANVVHVKFAGSVAVWTFDADVTLTGTPPLELTVLADGSYHAPTSAIALGTRQIVCEYGQQLDPAGTGAWRITTATTPDLDSADYPQNGATYDWSPSELPAEYFDGWYDAAVEDGLDGDPIELHDLSGAGHDMTNATPALRPTIADGVLNGLRVARGDGATQFLTGTRTPSATRTKFLLFAKRSTAGFTFVFDYGGNASVYFTSDSFRWYADEGPGSVTLASSVGTSWHLLELNFASETSATLTFDGVASAPFDEFTGAGGISATTAMALFAGSGGALPTDMDVALEIDLIVSLPAEIQALVRAYIVKRWQPGF